MLFDLISKLSQSSLLKVSFNAVAPYTSKNSQTIAEI